MKQAPKISEYNKRIFFLLPPRTNITAIKLLILKLNALKFLFFRRPGSYPVLQDSFSEKSTGSDCERSHCFTACFYVNENHT